jgi:exopolyphosphatase/guanosine-5'-triphosphate,3'-diphosphate pyrophosphatase
MLRFAKLDQSPFFIILASVLLISGCATHSAKTAACVERRAIYDVGSGSTKLKVADVDFCQAKIKKVIYENAYPVDYASDHSHSKAGLLSVNIRKAGLSALEKLKVEADTKSPKKSLAVMTGIFRKAVNAEAYRAQLQKKLGIKFKIVSQDLEARYGFESVRAATKIDPEHLVVWDIGASTMQFSAKKNGAWVMDLNEMASVSFKEEFIRRILRKNAKKVYSPNPVGAGNAERGVALARKLAHSISGDMKFEIADPKAEIVGIGGVHRFSVAGQTGLKNSYQVKDVQSALQRQAKKTDVQIGGEYSATEVSNLILVQGYLEELAIRKVKIGKADISDGVLLHSESW